MSLKVNASFENGVFVPAKRPGLVEHERVCLTVEPLAERRRILKVSAIGTISPISPREPGWRSPWIFTPTAVDPGWRKQ